MLHNPLNGILNMSPIEQLKQQIDLHELAQRLGLQQNGNGNYSAPHRDDKKPSLSIYKNENQIHCWKDHGTGAGGSCIDLVSYAKEVNTAEALHWIRDEYNLTPEKKTTNNRPQKTKIQWLADKCTTHENQTLAVKWLTEVRGISRPAAEHAAQNKAIGFTTYTDNKKTRGNYGYGGSAVAFICRDFIHHQTQVIEYKYTNPEDNGNVKSKCFGEKKTTFWTADFKKVATAKTIILVESPINALSIDSCNISGVAALATLGASNLNNKKWDIFKNKQVICAFDNDSAGDKAAWKVHEELLSLNISCLFVCKMAVEWQSGTGTGNNVSDVNDYLQIHGIEKLKKAIAKLETGLLPGLTADAGKDTRPVRVFLPADDFIKYNTYVVRPDFTKLVKYTTNKEGEQQKTISDLCGFRVVAVSEITIQPASATLTGYATEEPKRLFSIIIQTPRSTSLVRKLFTECQLFNLKKWETLGAVFQPTAFKRMLIILLRMSHIGKHVAANLVGLAYKNNKIIVSEGTDCFFTEPEKQCPYHNMKFLSGPKKDAATVIQHYRKTFKNDAATMALVWGIGAPLKIFLGFWPHLVMQAMKAAGKSTLIKRIEQTIGIKMLSGHSLQTEFRILTSISHTFHPVGWEEISARDQKTIDSAVSLLQECYQYTITRRGADLTEFLLCAPVLLAGEDVPVKNLTGKTVATDLSGKKGPLLPDDLPPFPMREWLQFLSTVPRSEVLKIQKQSLFLCKDSVAGGVKDGAVQRICNNYATKLTAWELINRFTESEEETVFNSNVMGRMNTHISESTTLREPWIWLMEIILGEIENGSYKSPYAFEQTIDDIILFLRFTDIMRHLSQSVSLKDKFNASPIKSAIILHKTMRIAGVLPEEYSDKKRTIGYVKVQHLFGLSLNKLDKFGLTVSVPTNNANEEA